MQQTANSEAQQASGREGGKEARSLFADARRRPIVRRVDNFKTKPGRPGRALCKNHGERGKKGCAEGGGDRWRLVRLFVRWQTTRAWCGVGFYLALTKSQASLDRLIDRVDTRDSLKAREKACRYARAAFERRAAEFVWSPDSLPYR